MSVWGLCGEEQTALRSWGAVPELLTVSSYGACRTQDKGERLARRTENLSTSASRTRWAKGES